jgi:hypothetical protein
MIQRHARRIAIAIPTLKLAVLPGALVLPRLRLVLKMTDISVYKITGTRDLPRGAMWAQFRISFGYQQLTSPLLSELAARLSSSPPAGNPKKV